MSLRQQVNYNKTSVGKNEVLTTLDIREALPHNKYLGLPTNVGHSKKRAFTLIKDRITKKVKGLIGENLSRACKGSTLEGCGEVILTYAMSIFKLPSEFCRDIQF